MPTRILAFSLSRFPNLFPMEALVDDAHTGTDRALSAVRAMTSGGGGRCDPARLAALLRKSEALAAAKE